MILRVIVDSSLVVGQFVQWSESDNKFILCTDINQMSGVIDMPPEQIGDDWVAMIRQTGDASAIAGQDLPAQGGALAVDQNGYAVVGTDYTHGIIQARSFDEGAKVAGDLVAVWLR